MQRIVIMFVILVHGNVYCYIQRDGKDNISPQRILSKFAHRREPREIISGSGAHGVLKLVNFNGQIPNPCNNGGSLFHNIRRNIYLCQCSDEYEGRSCEIKTKVCFEENACQYYENSSTTYECRAVQGSGFVCYHHQSQYRENWCHNTKKTDNHRSICPENWTCLDHTLGEKQGYRCLPQGHVIPPKINGRRKAGIIQRCNCHNGGQCNDDETCVCLPHFTGLYCESQVNHCNSNPCPLNIDCKPVLGGYTCNCPHFRSGLCEETRRVVSSIMVNPRFIFHASQYVSVPSTCLFYVDKTGDIPKLTIDFGDGTAVTKFKDDFVSTNMLNEILISFLYEPVNTEGSVYLVNYTHTYETEGLHNIVLIAFNDQLEVTKLNFTVRVSSPKTCEFSVELINSAITPENATIYQRRHSINIYSVSVPTCPGTRLKYSWKLFAVPNIVTAHTSDVLSRSIPTVLTRTSEYDIAPYTLPFGSYELRLTVQMFEPIESGNKTVVTWFKIVKDKIVAHISEGNIRQVHKSEPFETDGSESYDPNFPSDTMRFEWTCSAAKLEDVVPGFCDLDDHKIISNVPVLAVWKNILKSNGVYVFKVRVESLDLDYAEQSVEVEVVSEDIELVRIECVQNCLGNRVITTSPMALKAITSNDNNRVNYIWTISYNGDAAISLDSDIEYYSDGDNFVTKPGALSPSQSYQISVKAEIQSDTDKQIGTAAIYLLTYPSLSVGFCVLSPSQGYALITKFKLKCFRFIANYLPVVYEVFQYRLPREEPVMISFGVSGEFDDITLAAGLSENDYSTALRVYASDSKGNFGFYELDITVFPAAVYTSLNDELAAVKKMITGAASAVVTNLANHEVQSAIRIILSASCSVYTLSQQLRYVTQLRMSGRANGDAALQDQINTVASFKDIMVEYLAQCELHSPIIAKYCSSTLTSILECDNNEISMNGVNNLSYANKKAVNVLDNIIDMLHNKTQHSEDSTVIRTDVLDIGTTILSSVSLLLQRPKDNFVQMLISRPLDRREMQKGNGRAETLLDSTQQEEQLATQTKAVMNSMNNYASLFARYMAPHEDDYLTNPKEDICISIQKTNRGIKTAISPAYVEVNVSILSNDSKAIYNLQVITLKDNPYWWEKNAKDINFPLIKVDVFTTVDESRRRIARVGASRRHEIAKFTDPVIYKADLKFLPPETNSLVNHRIIEGSIAVKPTWSYTDSDISVHKLEIKTGGKTILIFNDHGDDVLLRVTVKQNIEPDLNDFWEPEVIPKFKETNLTEVEKRSIYIEPGNNPHNHVSYYVGVLPHQATIRSLLGDIDPPLPDSFLYEKPLPKPNKLQVQNNYISYSFKAYSAQCLRWSDSKRKWTNHCKVSDSDLTEMTISCHCDGLSTIGASFREAQPAKYTSSRFSLFFKFVDNSLIFWFLIYTSVCFLGLFAWAGMWDRRDKKQDKLIFLADNKADDKYCYLVIVKTGRNNDPSTSSRVALFLEGFEGNSSVHILTSSKRRVMLGGTKNYFVLCTPRSLGDVFCLHLWHNHTGSRPTWYIEKIFVHDVQTHQISVFLFETWLTPLDADGTKLHSTYIKPSPNWNGDYNGRMGLSCYRILNDEILSWKSRCQNSVADVMSAGYHCWLGMCSRQVPWKNTRRRRVVLAYIHMCVLMASVTGFYPLPKYNIVTTSSDMGEEFVFELEEVIVGILAACIAFSVHCVFFGIAKNVAPAQSYTTDNSSRYVEELVVPMPGDLDKKIPTISVDEKKLLAEEMQLVNSYKSGDKRVIVGRRAMPLRLPRAHNQRSFYDEMISQMGPIKAVQRVRLAYVFSHTWLYPFWILLAIVLLIALHFILFYATFYQWSIGLRYLFATCFGFIFSFTILEPIKVMFFALWKMQSHKGIYVIEDRSAIALYITRNLDTNQLETNRSADIYKPPIT